MQILIYTLLNYINCSIKQDTNYEIARILLQHLNDLEYYSLEEAASLCHVSVSTLNRFCRIIGYQNYSTLRDITTIREEKVYPKAYSAEEKQVYLNMMQANMEMIEEIPIRLFNTAATMLYQANHIYLIGYGSFQYNALYFQKQMYSHGKLIEVINTINHIDEKRSFYEDDLIIIISIQGEFLKIHMDEVIKAPCRKLLITQLEDTSILSHFHQSIQCGKYDKDDLSKYAVLRVLEKIILSYHELYQPNVKE